MEITRRQELPESAYFCGSLIDVEVICVSYAWMAREHPDASGHHLSILAPLIEEFEASVKPAAVFLDYCCLFQHPRSEVENVKFKASFPAMNQLYGHQYTTLWVQSRMPADHIRSVDTSGWCFFEMTVGALGKRHHRHIDLGLLQVEHVRDFKAEVLDVCKAQRHPPLTPQRFNEELRQKVFTNKADHATVEKLYAKTFNEVLNFATVFILVVSDGAMRSLFKSQMCYLTALNLRSYGLDTMRGSLTTR
jgi:hypothetical protein